MLDPLPDYSRTQTRLYDSISQDFEADIDGGGRFDRFRFGFGGSHEAAVAEGFGLGLRAGYLYSGFDFDESGGAACPPAQPCFALSPWKSIHTLDIVPSAAISFTEVFQLSASVPFRYDAEAGSDENGLSGGIQTALRFAPSDRLVAGLGIGVQSELEQAAHVFPVISLDWRIRNDLRLVTTGGPEQGGGAALQWIPSRAVSLSFEAGWERRRFRTDRHGNRNPNGIAEYRAVPLLAGIALELTRNVRLDFHAGLAVAGELEWEDASGHDRIEQEFDAAPLVGGSLQLLF